MSENYFSKLYKLDVSAHVEKKGKFSYLSWPYAVKTLREADPTATWEVVRHDGMPYLKTECGYFVEVAVTMSGVTLSQIHPVLDNNNRPITQPNSFHINTSIQRGLVKAIALHGLGLYIYAGEDLPEESNVENIAPPASLRAKYQLGRGDMDGFETWVEKMQGEGKSFADMERILTERLQKKKEDKPA